MYNGVCVSVNVEMGDISETKKNGDEGGDMTIGTEKDKETLPLSLSLTILKRQRR